MFVRGFGFMREYPRIGCGIHPHLVSARRHPDQQTCRNLSEIHQVIVS
jgi:hypothetical protein